MTPLITLTTDFGTRDCYVAAMKGVIARRCPEARILDLTHDIPPQDVGEAAFFLAGACPWFPPGTIHVVVVDPGVGTARRALAARIGEQFFVCPDNGVLTLLARDAPVDAHEIASPAFKLPDISATFHGRDLFAPAAAALAGGRTLDEAGPPADKLVMLPWPEPRWNGNLLQGEVVHVDRFGNAVTNIHRTHLEGRGRPTKIVAGSCRVAHIHAAYGDVPADTPLALSGSADLLEISVNQGHAADAFTLAPGTPVHVTF